MEGLVGRDIGRYHIIEPLGEGGMATVYRAFDTRLEREVAIKVIQREITGSRQAAELLRRFEREAKVLAQLDHPNIVKVFDYGEYEGSPYLVMQFVRGGVLRLEPGAPLPYDEAARLLAPVARALEYAHEHKLVHRDVKPSNILLSEKGEPLLSDFGIAKILDLEESAHLTGAGVGIGTPAYMSPEQGLGNPVDYRSDIYSLGVVFYQMVTGRIPFQADTPMAIVIKHINDPLPRPRDFAPHLPDEAERIIFKAMQKKPEGRYASISEFRSALERLVERGQQKNGAAGPQSVPGSTATARAPLPRPDLLPTAIHPGQSAPAVSTRRISPWLMGLAALAAILVIAVLGFGAIILRPAASPALTSPVLPSVTLPAGLPPTLLPTLTAGPAPTFTSVSLPTPTPTTTPVPISTPTLKIAATMISPKDGMVMVYVPAGEFLMGAAESDRDASADERPQHQVFLDAFWIDRTEVTNAMFAMCVNARGCLPLVNVIRFSNPKYADFAATFVNWDRAKEYCAWAGRRLPSEAEWEKAARGTDGRLYPWGNQSPDCSLTSSPSRNQACPNSDVKTGYFPLGASPYGALDLANNVREWVMDWYDPVYYVSSPARNPQGPDTGQERVVRGGPNTLANPVSVRSKQTPTEYTSKEGFRCAKSP